MPSPLSASQVIVTVGTGASLSALGSFETRRALIAGRKDTLALAAVDAGLADVDLAQSTPSTPTFVLTGRGAQALDRRPGSAVTAADLEARFGAQLRANMGIRAMDRGRIARHVQSDVGAPLAHDLGRGGLRARAGLGFEAVRSSSLRDMMTLFDDDPRLGPSLQTQLFLYGGLGALACRQTPRTPFSELG
jgi:hypothetical protein